MSDWANFAVHCTGPDETLYVFAHWGGQYMLDVLEQAITELVEHPVGVSGRHIAARLLFHLASSDAAGFRGLGGFSVSKHLLASERPLIHVYDYPQTVTIGEESQSFVEYSDGGYYRMREVYSQEPPFRVP